MRTRLHIDDALLPRAREYIGETETATLVRMGLEALIQREAALHLAALGATMPSLSLHPRERAAAKRRP